MQNQFSSFLIGEGPLAVSCAETLLARGHEVRGVISSDSRVGSWAAGRGVLHLEPADDLCARLGRRPFDYLFSVVNFRLLPRELLELPRRAAINFHDAPLPRYAGTHATSWALMNREPSHGVTWHLMTGRADAGDILKQRRVEVAEGDTARTLNAKCYEAAVVSFAELVDELACGRAGASAQDPAARTFFPRYKRPPAGCVLAFGGCARDLVALVRALDFGPHPNPLGVAKLAAGGALFVVRKAELLGTTSDAPPGTITAVDDLSLRVSTACREVSLSGLSTIDGEPLSARDLADGLGLRAGSLLDALGEGAALRLTKLYEETCRHESFWVERLLRLRPLSLPGASRDGDGRFASHEFTLPAEVTDYLAVRAADCAAGEFLTAAFAACLARLAGADQFDVGYGTAGLRRELAGLPAFFKEQVPLRVAVDAGRGFAENFDGLREQMALAARHKTYARDVPARYPALGGSPSAPGLAGAWPIAVERLDGAEDFPAPTGARLTFVVDDDASRCGWVYDTGALDRAGVERLSRQFTTFLLGVVADPGRPVADLRLPSGEECGRPPARRNEGEGGGEDGRCLHELIDAAAARTPDAVAVVCEDEQLTYGELRARSNRLARRLRRLGVGPEALVGIMSERSPEMLVGLLGVLKAGGAYVPLDPAYPRERLSLMLEDSRVEVLLTQKHLAGRLPGHGARVICLDADWGQIAAESDEPVEGGARPDDLAYVIYTSGSTGRPKGVMVEHRNVTNFFDGMDRALGAGEDSPPGTWLAVTSISFDISVLELFWTLARGFRVVLHAKDDNRAPAPAHAEAPEAAAGGMEFSLFYFASDDGGAAPDKYRLLVEGAKFADRSGFAAVWTPERHFHPFGGLYPNPSVIGAFLAGITERVRIRAGSVVLPLHSPLRVAEEWSAVDNLSGGRVDVSFASGWHDRDFVLAPGNYDERREIMRRDIETVRRLWRGESLTGPGGAGGEVEVKIYPRPIQRELPVWTTAGGGPETFRLAGEAGTHLLTHLLFQSTQEIAGKIAAYREAWRRAGHPGEGHVTIMLHTFVGDDTDAVRELVRRPFTEYLRSSIDLIKKQAAAPHGESAAADLTEADEEAVLSHAFERYFETSGLFGTPQDCLRMIGRLKALGVDEVACLIDFGVETEAVIASLPRLDEVRELSNRRSGRRAARRTVPELIARHGVTHMQCTPSMARMLTLDPASLRALRPLKRLLVGGEALPAALAGELRRAVSGELYNMYGPTETTIWSTAERLDEVGATVPIGRPITNTQTYIVDRRLRPVPAGVAGELLVGGAGVARGYWRRPATTAEKFIPDPFAGGDAAMGGARLYRTGDLARYLPDGRIEFLGRIDHQVKIRGFRVEPGEIETALARHPRVREAAVVAREDAPGDTRLIAYLVAETGGAPDAGALRDYLRGLLPEQMVPASFVTLARMPQTPNGKTDRAALTAPDRARPEGAARYLAPQDETERVIAAVWQKELNLERVGARDNFFDLGGNSLLMVRVGGALREALGREVPLVELFEYPTVGALARHLVRAGRDHPAPEQEGRGRGQSRAEAMTRRRQPRRQPDAERAGA